MGRRALQRRGEDGALSPAFLVFLVGAAAASLFLVQFAHAHVLRTEAHTAADAAALAGARSLRSQMLASLAMAPPLGGGMPVLDEAMMRGEAAAYAGRNDAVLTSFSRTGMCRVRAEVRGTDGVVSGPSSELRQGRPEAVAAAEVQLPQLTGFGLGFACTPAFAGGLSILDLDRVKELVPGFPDVDDFLPELPPHLLDPPDPDDFDDPDDYDDAREAYEQALEAAMQQAQQQAQQALQAALQGWYDDVVRYAQGLLANGSEIRLVRS